ncbi:hypothetical protein DGG96_01030 [Legionella qingyii]|uniref:Uncharacterized protein n=1 Tax=Legionella qingyii TaxID=2184757 RepID=A0A317U9T1_9GAMM|nr:hypothetical protein [Legionella qingyii]PWY57047.1 hypothetical protein DGG96_03395 [Legionella qingyii]PWY57332.1 hypothetical protein DGG96_01030 [Legionella qingyii]RUR26421.1 hypothetical protein ELY20_00435 [Legionella qingyii]
MGILHISPDEHLKRVMGDPSDAILKQRELSEATYPLLVSYLGWLRRLNSIQNKNDVIHQNEQFLSEFIHLCEHNLLFFLTVTGQFDVIRSLFEDKDLLAKEIALLEEIEKEQAQAAAANLQDFVFVPRKKEPSLQQPEEHKSLAAPASEWEKSLYGLTNMDLFRYYEDEMQRITHLYHMKQIKQIDTTYVQHLTLMRETLDVINQDDNIREETKQKAIILYKKLVVIKEEMDARSTEITPVVGETPLEIEAIEKHHQIKKEKFKEAQGALEAFFEEVRHESPQLQKAYEKHQAITMSFQKEIQAIQSEWKKEMEAISVHYEKARAHALEDVDSSLSIIIDELIKCPADELDKEQINKLDMALMQLKKYKEELKTVEKYDATQILLNKCNKELENIVSIVQPILSEESKKRFDISVNLIKKVFILPQPRVEQLLQTPKSSSLIQEVLDVDSKTLAPRLADLIPEEQNVGFKSSTLVVEAENKEQHDSKVLNDNAPIPAVPAMHSVELNSSTSDVNAADEEQLDSKVLSENISIPAGSAKHDVELNPNISVVEAESEEHHDSTVLNGNTSISSVSVERGVDLKFSSSADELMSGEQYQSKVTHDEKAQIAPVAEERIIDAEPIDPVIEFSRPKEEESEVAPSEEPQNSLSAQRYRFYMSSMRDRTEFIEFDPEKQHHYESMIEELSTVLSELNEDAEPEIAEKIAKIENLIEDVKSIGFDKASPSHIQKICEACNLGIDYDPLNHVKDSLASMFQFNDKPQNSVGM